MRGAAILAFALYIGRQLPYRPRTMDDETGVQLGAFAELLAKLDDPFAERLEILRAAKLDEAQLGELVLSWTTRIIQATGEGLPRRYAEAYATASERLRQARRAAGGSVLMEDPRFLNSDVSTFREAAAGVPLTATAETSSLSSEFSASLMSSRPSSFQAVVPVPPPSAALRAASPWAAPAAVSSQAKPSLDQTALALPVPMTEHHDVDATAPIRILSPGPVLPFVSGPATPPPSGRAPFRTPPVGSGTADISSFVPRELFPFSTAASSSPPPAPGETSGGAGSPVRRLMHFDPTTGLRLPHPVWVDAPSDLKDGKR